MPNETAVAMQNPAPLSSVQIEGRAKGPPAITVKVYDADPERALALATALYDEAVAYYQQEE